MNMPKAVETTAAPGAIGPYSQAVYAGGLVFSSGQLPLDPAGGAMPEDIKEQAAAALRNIENILKAAGTNLSKVVKTTVYLVDMQDFQAVNEVYASFFTKPYPARSCFAVRELPLGARVEIEAVALA